MPRRMARSSSITRITRAVIVRSSDSPGTIVAHPERKEASAGDQIPRSYAAVTFGAFLQGYRASRQQLPPRRSNMRTKAALVSTLTVMIPMLFWNATPVAACQLLLQDLGETSRTALHGSPAEVTEATAVLRQAGPAGMEAMLALTNAGDALDRVCGVRDCGE